MLHGGFVKLLLVLLQDQARTIRIPVHMVETINKLIRISRQLLQDKGREPLPEEIAEGMGITVERVREIQKIAQEPVSLKLQLVKRKTLTWETLLRTKMLLLQTMQLATSYYKNKLKMYLHALTDREQQVLILRFGLKGW